MISVICMLCTMGAGAVETTTDRAPQLKSLGKRYWEQGVGMDTRCNVHASMSYIA